jgi:glutathione S-transferase
MTAEYAARNPALTTPVLELEPGSYLPESSAILLHLAEGTDFLPTANTERAQVYRWLFFEQSAILPTVADLRFGLLTGRVEPDGEAAEAASRIAHAVIGIVEGHLEQRQFVVAERYTIADIGLFSYVHVAGEANVEMDRYPAIATWLERVRSQPGHVADLEPYPENARPGKGRSIHDIRFSS